MERNGHFSWEKRRRTPMANFTQYTVQQQGDAFSSGLVKRLGVMKADPSLPTASITNSTAGGHRSLRPGPSNHHHYTTTTIHT